MTDYLKKALAEWSWADIEMLVENEVEEDTTFELKEDLSSDGNDPWQASQKKISGQARDSLAKEIVAFANAYGGTIALGIVESKDQPPRATSFKLIKKCVECAERLEQAIRQIVDPPLSGFEVKGIKKPNSEGDGAVILRVASSLSAPHGHGRPPQAYVRRSNKSEPLTMRDLHDRFWEARSRRERVEKILEERKAILLGFLGKRASGHLINDRMEVYPQDCLYVGFRCTILFEQRLDVNDIFDLVQKNKIGIPQIYEDNTQINDNSAFHIYSGTQNWSPRAHGAEIDKNTHKILIRDDGLVEISGLQLPRKFQPENNFHPSWFAVSIAQLLTMAVKLRQIAQCSDASFIFECEFKYDGKSKMYLGRKFFLSYVSPEPDFKVGPFKVGPISELETVFRDAEREVWRGFGIPNPQILKVDFDKTLSEYLK